MIFLFWGTYWLEGLKLKGASVRFQNPQRSVPAARLLLAVYHPRAIVLATVCACDPTAAAENKPVPTTAPQFPGQLAGPRCHNCKSKMGKSGRTLLVALLALLVSPDVLGFALNPSFAQHRAGRRVPGGRRAAAANSVRMQAGDPRFDRWDSTAGVRAYTVRRRGPTFF